MSVRNEFTIETYGITHCVLFRHVPLMEDLEDRRQRQARESRDIEDGQLLHKGMKDDRVTVTGDDLHMSI